MHLFQRIFFAAVLSGLAAGLAMSAVQQWKVIPLIAAAELYESATPETAVPAGHSHDAASPAHEHAEAVAHSHDDGAWAPQDGFERSAYTVLANLLGAMGFTLVLGAVSVLSGLPITARNGVVWGLGGFLAFQLAPAFGLAPELPGMPAADLVARQVWWVGTALATGAALLLIASFRNGPAIALGAVVLVLPHLIGAPRLAGDHASAVPAHLATEFAAAALVTGALFWLIAGPLLGWLNDRFAAAAPGLKRAVA